MASIKSSFQARSWNRHEFLVSTDSSFIPLSELIEIFDSNDLCWARALPSEAMREMLENSLSFGLYEQSQPGTLTIPASDSKFIGVARCVTDFVTFAYLTDVWVDPSYQGRGLGSWLVQCVQEVLEAMPHLRRSLLFTGDWKRSGRGHPSYGHEGTAYGQY
ncbi:gcn5-related n-acetyltransferase [Polychaeton citri CBS 116435]|uniref:Gcn5-related n-acetyltransferase n=1 Tax=Polychaeton citri CBS 116435 TaxID=1314669 RepID=A0A9P4QG23_9PEZI|nr:gcn5-related n-acetyltransferase [Polychaeton citri CBS 116435]